MTQFTVFGNPIAHSLSPQIHQQFAAQFNLQLDYTRSLTSKQGFAAAVAGFFRRGGAGANVTVPFKEKAAGLVTHLTARAAKAGAVNTLIPLGYGQLAGDTTDGEGLLRDLQRQLAEAALARTVIIIGAGGAARGVIEPLQQAGAEVVITNRSAARVAPLLERFPGLQALDYSALTQPPRAGLATDTILINATSASLSAEGLPVHPDWFAGSVLTYDMMYGREASAFLQQAQRTGAGKTADGLGMLVEQAALAFALWHEGKVPDTDHVVSVLRASLTR